MSCEIDYDAGDGCWSIDSIEPIMYVFGSKSAYIYQKVGFLDYFCRISITFRRRNFRFRWNILVRLKLKSFIEFLVGFCRSLSDIIISLKYMLS